MSKQFKNETCGTCARFACDAKTDGMGACLDLLVRIASGKHGYGEVSVSRRACASWVDRAHDGSEGEKMEDGANMPVCCDDVSHPSHYTSGEIECKDAMRAAMECAPGLPPMAYVWWGFAFKYLWRWRGKDGLKDLRKCQQCIEFIVLEIIRGEKDGE